ncbi:MAG: hypothetical protein RL441_1359 [Actinomycetota bacterium]
MSKPVGTITRGTTAPNRLRRIDRWLIHSECSRLRATDKPVVVDLGYGALPITAWELRERLHQHVDSRIRVVGIEIDPERVAAAQPLADSTLSFIRGGFEVPVVGSVTVIRALNVLRQYDESEVVGAWNQMTSRLDSGGLLIDGTCDEIGRRAVWVALRPDSAGKAVPQSLSISVHLQSLERPSDVAPRLPKILIHRNIAGEPVHDFLSRLDDAWERCAGHATFGARQRWIETIKYATSQGMPTLDNQSRWRLGELTVPWSLVAPK